MRKFEIKIFSEKKRSNNIEQHEWNVKQLAKYRGIYSV